MSKINSPRTRNPVTADAVRRVQKTVVAQNDGKTPKGSLAAKLQSVYDRQKSA